MDNLELPKEGESGLYRVSLNDYEGLKSFNFRQKKMKLICASRVNVVQSSSKMQNDRVIPSEEGFRWKLFLHYIGEEEKIEGFPFRMTYFSKHEQKFSDLLGDIEKEEYDDSLYRIKFFKEGGKNFTFEFKYLYEYKTFRRILELKTTTLSTTETEYPSLKQLLSRENIKDDILPIFNDTINNYSNKKKVEKETIKKKLSKFSAAASGPGTGKSIDETLYFDLLSKPPEHWTLHSVLDWLRQIPMVNKKNELMSLHDYLSEVEIKLDFDQFLAGGGAPFLRLRREIQNFMNISTKERKKVLEDTKNKSSEIRRILSQVEVVKRLSIHFKILKHLRTYRPSYYIVLKKQISNTFKQSDQIKNNPSSFVIKYIQMRELRLLFDQKHLWSVFAVRRKILFNLLFGKSLEMFCQDMKLRILKITKENPNKISIIDAINIFKEENGIEKDLEIYKLDLEVWLEYLSNVAKLEYSKWNDNVRECKKRIANLDSSVRAKFSERLSQVKLKLEDPDLEETKRSDIEKTFNGLKQKVENMVQRGKRLLEAKFDKLVKTRNEKGKIFKMSRLSDDQKLEKRWHFYVDEVHYNAVDNLIERSINELFFPSTIEKEKEEEEEGEGEQQQQQQKQQKQFFENQINKNNNNNNNNNKRINIISFSSKLVLSRRLGYSVDFLPRFSSGIFNALSTVGIPLDFFKFGFTHGYIIICNIGIHWGGSSVVYLDDLRSMTNVMKIYEDLSCLDAQDSMFSTPFNFIKLVNNISRLLINWNSNFMYDKAGFKGRKYAQNCQEFALEILKVMKVPFPFYPLVMKYIDDLKSLHSKKIMVSSDDNEEEEKKEEKNVYRGVRITEDLPDSVKNLACCKDKKEVFFHSHKELDMFVWDCLCACENLHEVAPGFIQLLKSFDRAFWCQKMYRKFSNDLNEPAYIIEAGQKRCICNWFDPGEIHQ